MSANPVSFLTQPQHPRDLPDVPDSGATPRIRQSGFTLVELMIVVAIIGILASLAVTAYQTFTVRAQVAEGLSMAAGAKVPVADAYTNDGIAPLDRPAAGLLADPLSTGGEYVRSVNIVRGRVDIVFGGPGAHQDIVGRTLSLTPYETAGNTIIWRCGYSAAPTGNLLNGGADHVDPTVDRRYVPTSCRN